ncbi:NAD-dependent succinate-semialdehyde dehydrogenase [Kordiimonas marina]|uniref:NAD-dependent succinate-semialdehyde dehydrogenase n=1 Tax=Kordiimonas marina TaxID=2872312 RepID=UPI001FF68C85|nr:NAD-dependent succinate-semialdehyde dehydrogenase [Kordiimonas marina]MCJ9427550.1 NAD-dependent succinate-semialdehyde dehydrogenase [Kordiimonas marina]
MPQQFPLVEDYFVKSDGLDVFNPATGEKIATVGDTELKALDTAIDAAEAAFPAWAKKTAKERAALLQGWFRLILQHTDDLAAIMTAECGKPLAEARGEVAYGASFIEWFAEEGKRIYGDVIPSPATDKRIVVLKQPIGVMAAITPWNFPLAMITRKVAPALAAGCTAIVKPAEATPLSALALEKLAHQAGIPADVFRVVTTTDPVAVGKVLTSHPAIRKLSFTGSTAVGRQLMAQCAGTIKKVSLELGGNAPFIVFDDADLDQAVAGAMASKYRNAGQTCVCANRFLVQAGIHDAFVEKLTRAVAALQVGNGAEPGVTVGPLINRAGADKVAILVDSALASGASTAIGGSRHGLGGNFYEPTILTGITPDMEIAQAEIFGPVAPIFRFETEEDVIRLANDTPYGLAAYFYARDIGRVWRVAEALEYGMVGVNEGIISTEVAPFGGVKQSGLGREGSRYGIEDYIETKYLCLGGI